MAQFHVGDEHSDRSVPSELKRWPGRRREGIYRAVGLAAVANELQISKVGLDPEVVEAVERGAHYLHRVKV